MGLFWQVGGVGTSILRERPARLISARASWQERHDPQHLERSLAQHYNPLAMDQALVKAHAALDRVMDSILDLPSGATEKERQTRLMELYAARE